MFILKPDLKNVILEAVTMVVLYIINDKKKKP